ncbi:MAG: nucleotidyl transferase AbiEii/AbiGii toxin family protein [Lentimicrobiaceae bacterium]|nr:nucleotidyl transferase AbiEii/AbiGii toxin family protein [Lentimicrobiaceae bacterium]
MRNISKNISGKLDSNSANTIFEVLTGAQALSIEILLVGALARDIYFEHIHGIRGIRRTTDIDFAVMVESIDEYRALKKHLIVKYGFTEDKVEHRLEKNHTLVDLVPFGEKAFPTKKVKINENGNEMDVSGFDEVFRASIYVLLSETPRIEIRMPDAAGMVILKLLSFKDDPSRWKDAEDIYFIMNSFEHTIDNNYIYNKYNHLLSKYSYDFKKISYAILGEQAKAILNDENIGKLRDIIFSETKDDSEFQLIMKMKNNDDIGDFENILKMMKIYSDAIS